MTKFQVLIKIELLHEYFKNGKCQNTRIYPNEETKQFLKSSGMFFEQKENIGYVLAPDSFNSSDLNAEDLDFQLQFSISPEDNRFVNFTEFPIDELGKYIFSTDASNGETTGSIVLDKAFEQAEAVTNELAIVQLKLSEITKEPQAWPIEYVVQFESRAIPWKYFVINNQEEETGKELRLDGKGAELFNEGVSTTLINGSPAILFDSGDNRISLKEVSDIDMKLVLASKDNVRVAAETKIAHLPNANANGFQKEESTSTAIYAAIYVYI